MLDTILTFLNLLSLFWCPNMNSILKNAPRTLEKMCRAVSRCVLWQPIFWWMGCFPISWLFGLRLSSIGACRLLGRAGSWCWNVEHQECSSPPQENFQDPQANVPQIPMEALCCATSPCIWYLVCTLQESGLCSPKEQWPKPSQRKRNAKRQNGCLRKPYK